MKRDAFVLVLALTAFFVLGGCGSDGEPITPGQPTVQGRGEGVAKPSGSTVAITSEMLDAMNLELESHGKPFRVAYAEYITDLSSGEIGQTIYAKNVGNKQLGADFVPFDARRTWSGPLHGATDDITYTIDQIDATPPIGGLTATQTNAAIMAAMMTWSSVSCSNLPITYVPDGGKDLGYTAFLEHSGGSRAIAADIMHAGFSDMDFGGAVLGVTFTYLFVEGDEPTDIDGDGKFDVAFREIYYDPSWNWQNEPNMPEIDGNIPIDVQSIAVHETGHGLSQGHFGFLFITDSNGKGHLAPLAVMNAGYTGSLQELQGSDIAGHCTIWSDWPIH